MSLMDKFRDSSTCRGRYGMVEDSDGNTTKGIEMKCPGHEKDRVVVPGDKDEAEQKARPFLEDNDYKARIVDET